jgi:catechol 2,3-dioxygenase-like lactoylglutathione lyase family enzyme
MKEAAPPLEVVAPATLNHVHLTAEDPEAEIRFLVEALGCRRDPTHPGMVWCGNMQLAVAKGEPVRNPRFHLGFRMDSASHVDSLRARLARLGIATTDPVAQGSYYSCYFQDPAGYRFEVYADGGIPAWGTLTD